MVFSSSLFLVFFLPIFLLAYYATGAKYRNYTLLGFSLLFYTWGAPKFVFVILASLTANYFVVEQIQRKKDQFQKRIYLFISVFINIGLLAYFKYANFFVDNLSNLLLSMGTNSIAWAKVALPIGVSFFTFQSLTYTVDVYKQKHEALKKISDYFLYILMFPQLIAGPIIRFNTIADQIIDEKRPHPYDERIAGFIRFCIGLAKKVLIANVLGEEVDRYLGGNLQDMGTSLSWIIMIAYSFQIYFDFSGYSDMAIGIGRMLGFKFPENFDSPYISRSITEFWRRWHITLGAWMKDYLYIPLGGNKVKTQTRLFFNLGFVFLISGLWHGAAWNFVLWGAFHGFFLILDRLFLKSLLDRVGKIPAILFTYMLVVVSWGIFRLENLDQIGLLLKSMFGFRETKAELSFEPLFIMVFVVAILFSFASLNGKMQNLEQIIFYKKNDFKTSSILLGIALILLVLSLAFITSTGFNPFIYFRF